MFFELANILLREFKLRCPCCGHGHLFQTKIQLCIRCEVCDERETRQWFGFVYLKLLLALVLPVAWSTVTKTFTSLSTSQQTRIGTLVAALGPLVFYRLSKEHWTSIVFLGEGLYIPWPNR